MDQILEQIESEFPFDWAELTSYRDSKAFRNEIYLRGQSDLINDLISLFYNLFGNYSNDLLIYDESWWDFCLDTWDFCKDVYNYDFEGKSDESKKYLSLLYDSHIEVKYSGCCICNNWENYLKITLSCIITHQAPYSHLFCDVKNGYFFYFHHTGSIGIYYKEKNSAISEILLNASKLYIIED